MALPDLTGLNIEDTYQRVLQTDGINIYDGTGSVVNVVNTGSFATTGSNTFYGTQTINGNLDIAGTASIAFLNVSIESSSIIYSSGSNQFGDAANDTQTLYGSVVIPTGSLTVNGNISASGNLNINNSPYQIWIGDDIDEQASGGALKLYNTNIKGILSTYYYNSTLELRSGVSGSSFVNNWSKIELSDNQGGNGYVRFYTSGSERVRITNTGNVGIGTTTPANKLSVHENDSSVFISARFITTNTNLNYILLNSGIGANHYLQTNARTLALSADENGSGGVIRLKTNNINALSVNSSQNVGIGIDSSLLARLHTRGSGATSATTALRVENTNTSASLVVLDNGFVGIGTTTPSASLHISGASSATLLEIDSPAVNNILFVSGSGNVGIGTGTPSTNLDVSGSGRFTNGLSVTGSITSAGTYSGQSSLATGLVVNNTAGSTSISDFQVKTQIYDAIKVIAGTNSLSLMSNATGLLGFFGATPTSQSAGWGVTNLSPLKSYDANTITLEQLADVVGTLVTELKNKGLLG